MKQVQLRNNAEIWITDDEAKALIAMVNEGNGKLIVIGENAINPKDIVGIFSEDVIFDKEQKRRGLWKATNGEWLTKQEKLFLDPYIPSDEERLQIKG